MPIPSSQPSFLTSVLGFHLAAACQSSPANRPSSIANRCAASYSCNNYAVCYIGNTQAMVMSFLVIIVSEIGDKTFLIAAVLAMRHSRLLIFSAAMSALFVMTVLSALLGQVLPNLLSKQYTQIFASLLFVIFGLRLLREGFSMTGREGQQELEEVTQELTASEKNDDDLESQSHSQDSAPESRPSSVAVAWNSVARTSRNLAAIFFSPVWIQAFLLTFVAEWGDRSQIATVALAGAEDFWWVTIGGLLGHAICSGIAVMGGRMLAARISVKSVTIIGAIMFVLCGVFGFYQLYMDDYAE
eukprot:jgi/Hompol1/1966/HPOL_002809-RA